MTKQSRKDLLKREDAFIVAAESGAQWLQKHRVPLGAGLAALTVVGLVAWGSTTWMHRRDEQAAMLFAQGWKIMEDGIVKAADPNGKVADANTLTPSGSPADANHRSSTASASSSKSGKKKHAKGADAEDDTPSDAPTFASEKEQWLAARQKFQEVVEHAGLKGIGAMAGFVIADLDDKLQDREAAEKILTDLRKTLSNQDHLYFLAAERYAYLREAQGDVDGALAALSDVAADDQHFYSDYAQYHQARLYLARKDADKARSLLEHMERSFPNSSIIDDVRAKLSELGEGAAPSPQAAAADPNTPGHP